MAGTMEFYGNPGSDDGMYERRIGDDEEVSYTVSAEVRIRLCVRTCGYDASDKEDVIRDLLLDRFCTMSEAEARDILCDADVIRFDIDEVELCRRS